MAGYEDVEAIVADLPEVSIGVKWNRRHWNVRDKGFVWERPFSKADVKRWDDGPLPAGPVLGVATRDLNEKEAILAAGTPGVFTIPHFDGYPAVLVDLAVVDDAALSELVVDAWLGQAPPDLADAWLAEHPGYLDRGGDTPGG